MPSLHVCTVITFGSLVSLRVLLRKRLPMPLLRSKEAHASAIVTSINVYRYRHKVDNHYDCDRHGDDGTLSDARDFS